MSAKGIVYGIGLVVATGLCGGCAHRAKKKVRVVKVLKPRDAALAQVRPLVREKVHKKRKKIERIAALPRRLATVYFDFNRSLLTASARQVLDKHVAWLKAHKQVQVRIAGHCDQRGSTEYNLLLGERRARKIKSYLMGQGIPARRLKVISYGHQKPADSRKTREAFDKNRRGEFHVLLR